jgi:hypothetical protein
MAFSGGDVEPRLQHRRDAHPDRHPPCPQSEVTPVPDCDSHEESERHERDSADAEQQQQVHDADQQRVVRRRDDLTDRDALTSSPR